MKVCTDSCLFGAWAANHFRKNETEAKTILDIGSGTGLLSLMLMQKLPCAIVDAVEMEPACFRQLEYNIRQSLWRDRIEIYNEDIKKFTPEKKYNIIISNPPFYESGLHSVSPEKNVAHHDAELTLRSLITVVKNRLANNGNFAVLLPYFRATEFEKAMNEESFFTVQKTFIRQTGEHSFFRAMFLFSRQKKEAEENEITIKENDNTYSPEFVFLLKDYYLHL